MGDPELALAIAFRVAAAALAVGLMEQLTVYERAFGPYGPFSASIANALGRSALRHVVDGRRLFVVLSFGAVAATIAAVLGPFTVPGRLAGLVVLVCVIMSKWRRVTASDGAEQLALLTIFATCVAVVPSTNLKAVELGVWFVAGQTILSYSTAGIAKALSPTWRGGTAIALIMGSESHGQPGVSALLEAHPALSRLLTRAVIFFECAFLLVLIGPLELTLIMLVVGFLFHAGCAVTMGLNSFLLVFPGTYACVAYVAQRASPFW